MSSYRRFISYMYDYQHGQKRKNCGFIKVEVRNHRCMIYFQLKNAPCQETCNVYLYCQGQEPEYAFLQEIPVKNGMVNYKLETSSVHMTAKEFSFSQCQGLLCTDEKGNDCGTCWEGDGLPAYQPENRAVSKESEPEPVVANMKESESEPAVMSMKKLEPMSEIRAAEETAAPPIRDVYDGNVCDESKFSPIAETCDPSGSSPGTETCDPSGSSPGTETCDPQSNHATHSHRPKNFSQLWEHMQKEFPAITPFDDHAIVETIKIAPSDLGYLQACSLNLGTNQFLLHGYHSYNHLLLGRIHGQMRYVVGIPGVYDSQEQFMAKTFGFPCFKPVRECRQKNGQFGYWLRCFRQDNLI